MRAGGPPPLGLVDTSVFIAVEQGRSMTAQPPTSVGVSVVTVAELRLGVLAAADAAARARRLETVTHAEALDPVPIDVSVAHAWASLRVSLREAGRRMPVNDSWIAATALALGIPVVSQDADYDEVPGLDVIRV